MNEIKPALTADEWADVERNGEAWLAGAMGSAASEVDSYSPPPRHALAALALHGQPFGFTWEDVDEETEELVAIENRLRMLDDTMGAHPTEGQVRTMNEVRAKADRKRARIAKIAALLPPRTT